MHIFNKMAEIHKIVSLKEGEYTHCRSWLEPITYPKQEESIESYFGEMDHILFNVKEKKLVVPVLKWLNIVPWKHREQCMFTSTYSWRQLHPGKEPAVPWVEGWVEMN